MGTNRHEQDYERPQSRAARSVRVRRRPLVVVAIAAIFLLGALAFSTGGSQYLSKLLGGLAFGGEGAAVVTEFMEKGRDSDLEGMLAMSADPQLARSQAQSLLQERYYFDGFLRAETISWYHTWNYSWNHDNTNREKTLELEGE